MLFRMLIPKKNRTNIYEYLFKEGVMVAKKDFNAPRHPDLETVPNLQVIKAMQVKRSYNKQLLCLVFIEKMFHRLFFLMSTYQ